MKNLLVIHNNDRWTEKILTTIKSLFNNSKDDDYFEPDLLICNDYKGNIPDKKSINIGFINIFKPYVRNIFALIGSKITCLYNFQFINDLIYDNIIYFPISIGIAITNKIINELNIKYGKKLIRTSGDDIDRFYILNLLTRKNRKLIDQFILDCRNIISSPTAISYLPFKDQINLLFYTFPVDFNLYDNNELKNFEHKLIIKSDFNNLEMQLFTKPQPLKATIDALKSINKYQKYIRTLGLFPILTMDKRIPLLLVKFFRELKKSRASFVFFWRMRPLKTYNSQLETFNSLYIQRRGGITAVKYAILKGLLIFGDPKTHNYKLLTNDHGINILNLKDFNQGLYNKQNIIDIIHSNRSNMIQIVEKSKIYWYNLFSSKSKLENFKNE